VLNGDIDTFPNPDFAVDPTSPNRLFITYQAAPTGTNWPDVFVLRSLDGGKTWGAPLNVSKNARDQFRPSITVSPTGDIDVFWYDRRNDPANLRIDVYGALSANHGISFGPLELVTSAPSLVPKLNPSGDSTRRNCDFPGRIAGLFPGSGAYVAWIDGRDKGASANGGVDPNVYFAHVPDPHGDLGDGRARGQRGCQRRRGLEGSRRKGDGDALPQGRQRLRKGDREDRQSRRGWQVVDVVHEDGGGVVPGHREVRRQQGIPRELGHEDVQLLTTSSGRGFRT
jgi:hypothetical protein